MWYLFGTTLKRILLPQLLWTTVTLCSGAGIGQKLFRESSGTISTYVSLWREQPELYGTIKNIIQIA